jgi:hypothetical protein
MYLIVGFDRTIYVEINLRSLILRDLRFRPMQLTIRRPYYHVTGKQLRSDGGIRCLRNVGQYSGRPMPIAVNYLISWLADLIKLGNNIIQLECVAFALISFFSDTKTTVANNFEIWAPYNAVSCYVMQIWNENLILVVHIRMHNWIILRRWCEIYVSFAI